jgi:hypothetical protein
MRASVRDAEEKEVMCAGEVSSARIGGRSKGKASDSSAYGPTFSFDSEREKGKKRRRDAETTERVDMH